MIKLTNEIIEYNLTKNNPLVYNFAQYTRGFSILFSKLISSH